MIQPKIELSQQLKLTPQLMQSLNILALNQTELAQFIDTLYSENPCVEISYDIPAGDNSFLLPGNCSSSKASEEDFDLMSRVEDPYGQNTLEDYLISQLNFTHLTKAESDIMLFIIRNLDENGFYSLTPSQTLPYLNGHTKAEVEDCLKKLQCLEPCGVCCQDLRACLCCQLAQLGEASPCNICLVKDCLELFAQGKYNSIKNKYGIPLDEIEAFKKLLPRLNPKPGASFGSRTSSYLIPDIFIVEKGDDFVAVLNSRYIPRVFVSDYYSQISESDEEAKKYIEHKMSSAQWAIKCLEKRSETILALAEEIIDANGAFFRTGKGALSCLKMQTVADKIGVHISTISRCARGKYLQCAYGTFLLKSFFSKASSISDSPFIGEKADSEILSALREVVKTEDKHRPLSDEKITALLCEKGFPLARRTVVKYRGLLGIPSSVERKTSI